jgi:uncharacterized protein
MSVKFNMDKDRTGTYRRFTVFPVSYPQITIHLFVDNDLADLFYPFKDWDVVTALHAVTTSQSTLPHHLNKERSMNILVICDDRWHPARTPRAGLQNLEAQGFHLDWIENAAEWSAAKMETYPLVILTKSNNVSSSDETPWMTPAVEEAFRSYVERGHGLLAIHSGLAGYSDTPVLRLLLGGVFVQHPAQCPVSVIPQPAHPLTQGAQTFTLQDEHYFMTVDDPETDVFLTTHSANGVQPGGWTRLQASGRVCVLTPGHNLEIWQHPSFEILLLNALQWCAHAS